MKSLSASNLWHKWTVGDNEWTPFRIPGFSYVCFLRDKFYAFSSNGSTVTIDPASLIFSHVAPPHGLDMRSSSFIVESVGDIFQVCVFCDYDNSKGKVVSRFGVKKLEEEKKQRVDVRDELKGRLVFVSNVCSFSVPAEDIPQWKPNCVYVQGGLLHCKEPPPPVCNHYL
ncbi:hypothetical protein Tsubulata_023476 [Turnera subulata]|uniref:KIB1-4 beta-propeller domain-containing protein n=1 Tax=Turnera subulata TaxID=218843 RepID=A0A9Q0F3A0_9ROSI|nr:hypothetical protein Tsubulata_023476 [Turnera subulata]